LGKESAYKNCSPRTSNDGGARLSWHPLPELYHILVTQTLLPWLLLLSHTVVCALYIPFCSKRRSNHCTDFRFLSSFPVTSFGFTPRRNESIGLGPQIVKRAKSEQTSGGRSFCPHTTQLRGIRCAQAAAPGPYSSLPKPPFCSRSLNMITSDAQGLLPWCASIATISCVR